MMDRQEIAHFIHTSGIGVDQITLNQTLSFLQNHVGNLSIQLEHYQILSATAIVGETIILKDITQTRRAKSGITLQHVMRHIGKLSKELYLQVLSKQVQKWRQAPLWLRTKTCSLQISYRIYKKYRLVFDQLTKQTNCFCDQNRFNVMAIFWIVYLFIKNQNPQFDNPVETTTLLHSIVLFIFSQLSVKLAHKQSSPVFRQQFLESKMPLEDKYIVLRALIINKLNDIHAYRYNGKAIQLKQLTNIHYTERYLDDSSDLYEKLIHKLPENTVNQIYFLELAKTLTPCAIKILQPSSQYAISKRIDFTQSDDEENDFQDENEQLQRKDIEYKSYSFNNANKDNFFNKTVVKTEPPSPFRVLSTKLTPVTSRHMNSNWLNGITSTIVNGQTQQIANIYQRYTGRDFSQNNQLLFGLITNSIYEFTPDCRDFTKRQQQIYQLYSYFINRVAEAHTQSQMTQIFKQIQSYRSILCLCADLFNYANQGLEGSYGKYCKVFQISILQGHKAISWFGKHISLPKTIQSYVYSVQKKILIEEIWHNNQGYFLLSKQQKSQQHILLVKRLQKHANERTQQLCFKMNILDGQIIKIVNLVKYILNKRSILLKNHRVDQIIVCSIASILSINQSHSKYTLQQIFDHYNQLIFSFYSNKNDLYDSEGNRIDLVNFYNQIFLPSVQSIVNGDDNQSILSTPVRLQRQKSKQLGIQMTPFSFKFKQTPKITAFAKLKFTEDAMLPEDEEKTERKEPIRRSFYKQSLIRRAFVNQQNYEQDSPDSPTFRLPSMQRDFSFGKLDPK